MPKSARRQPRKADLDTMRPEYDFAAAMRGVTSARHRAGTSMVVIDPDLLDVFPDAKSANDALLAID